MEKNSKKPAVAVGLVSIALVVWHFVNVSGSIALTLKYRWHFLPYHFGIMMVSSSVILVGGTIIKRFWPTLHARVTFNPKRLEKPLWAWVRKRGAFLATLVFTSILGPLFAAGFLQFMAFPARRAWAYATISNVIVAVGMIVFWVYLRGPIDAHLGHIHWIHRLLH